MSTHLVTHRKSYRISSHRRGNQPRMAARKIGVRVRTPSQRTKTGSNAPSFEYFITDHLGSVAVVTDSTGTVLSNGRLFYDPWGKMKLAGGGNDTNCSLPQVPSGSPTTRGFTGQEQMPNICADNFNARVYNPLLGRFLTPDSVIPDTYAPQSLNRYTYVDNMPLSVTDPTGHVDAPGDSQKKLPNKLPPPWEPAPNGGACRCARIGNVVIASDSSGHVLAVFDIGLLDDAAAHQAADGDGSAASATTSGVASRGAGNPVAG